MREAVSQRASAASRRTSSLASAAISAPASLRSSGSSCPCSASRSSSCRCAFQASAWGRPLSLQYTPSASLSSLSSSSRRRLSSTHTSPSEWARCTRSQPSVPAKRASGLSTSRFTPPSGWVQSSASLPAGVGHVFTTAPERKRRRTCSRSAGSEASASAAARRAPASADSGQAQSPPPEARV